MSDVKITETSKLAVQGDVNESFKLKRGEQVNLTRLDPTLRRLMIGVGWDVIGFDKEAPDLDLSIFLLDKNNETRMDEDFVFYNNLKSLEGAVEHMGDNRTGAGDGDDENVLVDLMSLPFEVYRLAFVISIYDAEMRDQNLQSVRNCFLRIMNDENGIELMRFNLDQEFKEHPESSAVIVGFLERNGPNWFFEGTGVMTKGGLKEIATKYGIVVAY
ncbi:MAG: TerD family protein [Alphaproteobacteria bacterium]|jgi:tellurium resistance protein TerD|nr:TerD family protein [Alphaproteobacteria bacterium]MCB1551025.1 TerD family protein [Alphaproteobacteria bacterium]MCB9985849.1 TerD family protein [Micavibrio sp.]HPQ50163.1 TerD family protein [Alphaproteobacteria bacterium]HRK97518.1 TerD family protein [Alphaproteobacteria bacterium]